MVVSEKAFIELNKVKILYNEQTELEKNIKANKARIKLVKEKINKILSDV